MSQASLRGLGRLEALTVVVGGDLIPRLPPRRSGCTHGTGAPLLILKGAASPLELRTAVADDRDADLWRCGTERWAHTCHAVLLGAEATPGLKGTVPPECAWPIVAAPKSEYL